MKKNISKMMLLALSVMFGASFCLTANMVFAEEQAETVSETASDDESSDAKSTATSIGITPVSKILQLASDSEYTDSFTVNNDGESELRIEVYAAPYSYVYSEADDAYRLGFNNENNYTQIARWVTFKDSSGNYVKKPTFTIAPNSSIDIHYKITTPSSIPAGGQYAVLFAHTLTAVSSANGIRTEASPGLVVYGRSTEGETIISAQISDMNIAQTVTENDETRNVFRGSAKVKNDGNVDFNASGVLKVEGILGAAYYETPTNAGRVSVIPEAELIVSDEWKETPDFGLFKVTWTVKAGEETETIERVVFLISPIVIVTAIILLTILIVWIIIMVKKRKERRSRFVV